MELSLREVLTHPLAVATALVSALGGALGVPVFTAAWGALWATAGKAFAFVSLVAFTLAPRVDFVPEQPLVVLALVLGGIVIVKRGWRWLRSFATSYEETTS